MYNNKNVKIMKKNLFLAALAFVALAGCTSDEFVGENTSPTPDNTAGAIQFASNTPRITRAEGASAAEALDYKFKVYGTKTVTVNSSDVTSNVFATNAYGSGNDYSAEPYWVWYAASTAGTTTSDTKDWDYVGAAGTHGTAGHLATIAEGKDQTIKYWDYSAKTYEFVAYSATHTTGSGENATPKITKYKTSGFTVEATAADLAGLYVADKITLNSSTSDNVDNSPTKPATSINKIGGIVQFTFRAAAAKVRLGIYETIPGYEVRNVNFRPNGSEFTATKTKAILSGSFNGSSSSGSAKFNVTYGPHAIFTQEGTTAQSSFFDFGTFDTDADPTTAILGTTSTSPTWATGSSDYQSVFPNTDHVGNMILYVDYDLYNTVTQETIHVYGAKAVVPQMYMTWNPNYAYTYLFKISDNTNGTTSQTTGTPEGLYPITFDAVTVAATDGQEVGTITTVSTPSITTYQDGSVSTAGITYAVRNPSKPIYITVTDNSTGNLIDLATTNINLYTVAAGTTEADLILTTKTKTDSDLLSILSSNEKSQGITFASGKAAKFTPAAGNTYAVEYKVSDGVYQYKIIVVAPAS